MKGIISLSIFIILAVVAWWTITTDYSLDNQPQQASTARFIEAYMNDFEMTVMDATGSPSYTLKGTHMEKFNDSDETNIQQPVFQLLQSATQWRISADSAIANDKHETIQLTNNVVMQQQNVAPKSLDANLGTDVITSKEIDSDSIKSAITIRTPNLLIHTKKQTAITQAPVIITQGRSKLNSNGMTYNNITSELELSSNVRGSLNPND